jgi:hypothetical protein
MKCYLYSNEELVGWADLNNTDPPMGLASGPFYPNDSYRRIQPVIREYHLYDGTLGEVDGQKRMEAQAKIDALRLSVITEDGEVLDPAGGVHIADFSEELAEDPYQLDVLGLSFDIFDRLFPLAWEEYLNRSEGKEQD